MLGTLGYPVFVGGQWYCMYDNLHVSDTADVNQLPHRGTYGIPFLEEPS